MAPLTWNADVEPIAPGAMRARVGVKWRNFLGPDGWTKIDLSPREAGGSFTVSQAPFAADVPTTADGWTTLESTNRFDIWSKRAMPDASVGVQKRYSTAQAVGGVLTKDGILFPLAWPDLGADRLVQFHEQEVRDLIVFPAEPPGSGPVELPLEIDFGSLPILASEGRGKPAVEADFRTDKSVPQGLSFTTGRFRGLKIKAPRVWDSGRRSQPIELVGKKVGSLWIGKKVIHRSFFDSANFPVFADTTTTFYPDPDTESTTVDGYIQQGTLGNVTWATLRGDSGAGASADDAGGVSWAGVEAALVANKWSKFQRSILLFDTSSIADTDTIFNASLWLNLTVSAFGYMDVVEASPASDTGLVATDYSTLGTTSFARVDTGAWTPSTYGQCTMNSSGKAAISPTGITKLGLRMAADTDDAEPSWSAGYAESAETFSADYSGTASDPYLEVDHGIGFADESNWVPAQQSLPRPNPIVVSETVEFVQPLFDDEGAVDFQPTEVW